MTRPVHRWTWVLPRVETALAALRRRIIGDWRRGWRFWSVRLQALAVASGAMLVGAPDALAEAWRAMPPELRALVPSHVAHWLPILLGGLAIAARFIRQDRPGHDG
jgi:hypothetical protein